MFFAYCFDHIKSTVQIGSPFFINILSSRVVTIQYGFCSLLKAVQWPVDIHVLVLLFSVYGCLVGNNAISPYINGVQDRFACYRIWRRKLINILFATSVGNLVKKNKRKLPLLMIESRKSIIKQCRWRHWSKVISK